MTSRDDHFEGCRVVWAEWLLIIAAIGFVFLLQFKLPLYPVFSESDHLIFLYEGWRLFSGDVLYRDVFEFTFPGSQLYYAALFCIFGAKYWVAPATVVGIAGASVWVLLRVSAAVVRSPLYLLPAIAFVFFGFRWFGLDASHRMFSPVLMMMAVLVVLGGTTTARLVTAGSLCALASYFTQQRGVVLLAGLVAFLVFEARFTRRAFSEFAAQASTLAAAFLVVLAVLCAPFAVTAGLGVFFDATVVYPLKYYTAAPPNQFSVYWADMSNALADLSPAGMLALLPTAFYAIALPLATLAIAGWMIARRRTLDWPQHRAPILLTVASLSSLITTNAPNQYRLFQISMPALALMAWSFSALIKSELVKKRVTQIAMAGLLALSFAQAVRFQTHWNFVYWKTPTGTLAVIPTESFKRYLWLSERSSPGDVLYEVYQPFAYFPLQLRNPTRYGQIWQSNYSPPEHVSEVIAALTREPPRYILWDVGYDVPQRRPGDNTEPLSRFVRANYVPVTPVYRVVDRDIQVWERKGAY